MYNPALNDRLFGTNPKPYTAPRGQISNDELDSPLAQFYADYLVQLESERGEQQKKYRE
jgi:hypothetical protein